MRDIILSYRTKSLQVFFKDLSIKHIDLNGCVVNSRLPANFSRRCVDHLDVLLAQLSPNDEVRRHDGSF